ncbi:hypothetical protein FRX31_035301 [Thalictrum thalictroides]|uniref:Uncharacterized protein n=1 Tax=Thalictrum thalictroides TaxID=46969 RepID=A0A7J6URA9_THATH|nr:hypothetical protein FRX31_035301 [Thalictrum thalictroides]
MLLLSSNLSWLQSNRTQFSIYGCTISLGLHLLNIVHAHEKFLRTKGPLFLSFMANLCPHTRVLRALLQSLVPDEHQRFPFRLQCIKHTHQVYHYWEPTLYRGSQNAVT